MEPPLRAPLAAGVEVQSEVPTQGQGRIAKLAQLTLHLLSFTSNIGTLVVYAWFEEAKFFWPLSVAWLCTSVVVSWAALRELKPRSGGGWWRLRCAWVVVVYGLCRGLQVRHILGFFRQRQLRQNLDGQQGEAGSLIPTAFNSKTFDGIIEGLFFAAGNQFAFFMLDLSPPGCEWYMTEDFGRLHWLRFLFLFSAVCSMLTVAAAIVEVDFRVSDHVEGRINMSAQTGFVHFAYRASEVVINLASINLVCIFLRPQPYMQHRFASFVLYAPFAVSWLLNVWVLHSSAEKSGAMHESLVAHLLIGLAAVAANPTQFVDRQIYREAAKMTARAFWWLRCCESVVIVLFIGCSWRTPFPKSCHVETHSEPVPPATIGRYTLWFAHSNHPLAYVEIFSALLVHLAIVFRQPYTRTVLAACSDEQPRATRDTSRRSVFARSDSESLESQVRRTVPRGLSSYLVQVGTGVTSKLFVHPEYRMTDFVLQKTLGRGGFGVVVLAEARHRGGESLPPRGRTLCALKLSNLGRDGELGRYAEREHEYLTKLRPYCHPFVIRLEHSVHISPEDTYEDADGEIKDVHGNRVFHKALLMEYCPLGDLEHFLVEKALEAPDADSLPNLDADESRVESLNWLRQSRRYIAQLVEAVRFLHGKDFTHRDLKPANVLLKRARSGREGLDVCLTDFGLAKQVVPGDPLQTVVGSPEYMAPEIRRAFNVGMRVGDVYTPQVDIYSLGKMIWVMLRNFKFWVPGSFCPYIGEWRPGFWRLQTRTDDVATLQARTDNVGLNCTERIPACALDLVTQMMREEPALRGTADSIRHLPFFQVLQHEGETLPALDYSDYQRSTDA